MTVLFLDLQKAFDTVSHDIVQEIIPLRSAWNRLLSSYLSCRKQFTKRKFLSDLASIIWGVCRKQLTKRNFLSDLASIIWGVCSRTSPLFNIYKWPAQCMCSLLLAFRRWHTSCLVVKDFFSDLELKFNTEFNTVGTILRI